MKELRKNSTVIADAAGNRSDFYYNAPQEVKEIIDMHESYHHWHIHYNLFGNFVTPFLGLDVWARFVAAEEVRAHTVSNNLLKDLYNKDCQKQ